MTEIFIKAGTTIILNQLAGAVAREIGLAWGVKDDLKKLQKTLQMILAVITDAERKQATDQTVRIWLGRLKEVVYDADDVMDEFSYESMRRGERGDRLKHKVLDFVSSSNALAFRFKMAKKIKDINKSLDAITKDMDRFGFHIAATSNTTIAYGESSEERNRRTTSLSSESDILGREEDKVNLINILTKVTSSSTSSYANREKVSVVSIVGMGGLGKTTLAQLIYSDELIEMHFDLKMWVHVSEYFDAENLFINIMESATEKKFDKLSNQDVLAKKVQEQLRGKKYLLVLDDLWNEDYEEWDKLRSVLFVGAQGSKILITTRKDQVASIVSGTIPPYDLKHLSDNLCWSMIQKKAFSYGGAEHKEEMINIGKEIARKCCGLPLAAKFLGSLLHSKNKGSDWILIRDDDSWNSQDAQRRVLSILRLSYYNLPSHLKQCFSICSIYPKNWLIRKQNVVQMWMAEGFLNPENKRSTEDFGNECFESLMWSSFFHYPKKNALGDIEACKMHDLVHDLALDVLEDNEMVSLKLSEMKNVSEVRRVYLKLDEEISTESLRTLGDAKKLRSIFVPESSNLHPTIFSRNKHLRLLQVGQSSSFSLRLPLKLPHLRLKLRHLRYLHLSSFNFSDAVNDRSISKLYNLETLMLTNMVGIQNLLANIQSLKKLRHLDISSSKMDELPDCVTSLCNLRSLNLSDCKLERLPDSATGLKYLRFLDMNYNPSIEKLPDFVTSLRNLEILNVRFWEKLKVIPDGVTSLSNLRIFNFEYCRSLVALPEDFGALTQLRYLSLEGTAINVLPNSCVDLTSLEFLHLGHCRLPKEVTNWKKLRQFLHFRPGTTMGIGELVLLRSLSYWVGTKEGNSIAELGKLDLLESLTICNLQNVRCLIDAKTANLKGKHLRYLRLHWDQVEDDSIGLLEALQPPTDLRELIVDGYSGVNFPTWMCDPSCVPNLDSIKLGYFSSMDKLPAAIGKLPSLRTLFLTEMSLRSLDVDFPFLVKLRLMHLVHIEELGHFFPSLQSLGISNCSSLIKIPLFPSLTMLEINIGDHRLISSIERSCTSLTFLQLGNIQKLEFLPLSILQNNQNLETLCIYECDQLRGFDNGNDSEVTLFSPEIQHGAIKKFDVKECPVLKFIPDLRGWTSLEELIIYKCPQVKESLNYDLKSLSSLQSLRVDFIQRDENRGDPSNFGGMINLLL